MGDGGASDAGTPRGQPKPNDEVSPDDTEDEGPSLNTAVDDSVSPPNLAAENTATLDGGELLPSEEIVEPPNGAQIHRYVVIEKIGHGGMSVVYKAYDPELNRRVAIKLLRPRGGAGFETENARMRLLREAQALAQLSHPNVIAVHDVGTWQEHVFLAMEFVEGESMRKWLRVEKRSHRDILRQFIAAGRGLAATHAVGLIHRDFKPDNVMVGGDGRVRVVDFGLARPNDPSAPPATADAIAEASGMMEAPQSGLGSSSYGGQKRAVSTIGGSRRDSSQHGTPKPTVATADGSQGDAILNRALTAVGSIAGTPAFMSPEQHCGLQIDARTDQFSFCVSLYLALYRRLPFRGSSAQQFKDAICSGRVEAPPSDVKIPARVRRVIARGLRVAPADRFASMDELLTELELATVNRRRQVAVGGLIAALSVLSVVGFVRRSRDLGAMCQSFDADMAAVWNESTRVTIRDSFAATGRPYATDTFDRVERTLGNYATRWVAKRTATCEATHVRGVQSAQLLDLRMACLDRRKVQLAALTTLLASRADTDVLDKAANAALGLPSLDACADDAALTAAFPPPEEAALREKVGALQKKLAAAQALLDAGKPRDAFASVQAIDAESNDVDYPPLRAEVRFLLGQLQDQTGHAPEAREVLTDAARWAGKARDDRLASRAWSRLIRTSGPTVGSQAEAKLFSAVAEAAIARAGDPPDLAAEVPFFLGGLDLLGGRYQSAGESYRRAVTLAERSPTISPHTLAYYRSHLSAAVAASGDHRAALPLFQQVLADQEQILGPRHPQVATTLTNLGLLYQRMGDFPKSLETLERSLQIQEQSVGPESHEVALALNNLGATQCELARYDDAVGTYRRAIAIWSREGEPPPLGYPVASLAQTLIYFSQFDEAAPLADRALGIFRKSFGDDHPDLAYPYETLGEILERRGRYADAEQRYRQGLAAREHEPDAHLMAVSWTEIARILGLRGKLGDGRVAIDKALGLLDHGASDRELAVPLSVRAILRLRLGERDEALADARRAVAVLEPVYGRSHPEVARALVVLGEVLAAAGHHDEAHAAFARAVAAFPARHPDLPAALLGLGSTLLAEQRRAEAIAPLERALEIPALVEGPASARTKARSLLALAH
ncbi:MAG: serine/threonine-protein kinase [Polyangiaceae bacterium]